MRVALIFERKSEFPFTPEDPEDSNSELLSEFEEHELLTGLRDAGHDVIAIGDGQRLLERITHWRSRCDLAFNRSAGYRGLGRKSHVPSVLELAGIPYVGSGPYVSSLTRHKQHAKLVVAAAGVPTAPAIAWASERDTPMLSRLAYPVIVKPVAESCSIGIEAAKSIVSCAREAADRGAWIVQTFKQPALVEQFIRGTEVEVPLLGWPELQAVGVVGVTMGGATVRDDMILASDRVYADDYGWTTSLPGLDCEAVAALAVRAARALDIRDYGRVDFRVTDEGEAYFIEASVQPHIASHSSFFVSAKARGASYPETLDELLQVTRRRTGVCDRGGSTRTLPTIAAAPSPA
jgi:D-alanine-D-alanine ligase